MITRTSPPHPRPRCVGALPSSAWPMCGVLSERCCGADVSAAHSSRMVLRTGAWDATLPSNCAAPAALLAAEASPALCGTTAAVSSTSKAASARAMASSTSSPVDTVAAAAAAGGGAVLAAAGTAAAGVTAEEEGPAGHEAGSNGERSTSLGSTLTPDKRLCATGAGRTVVTVPTQV